MPSNFEMIFSDLAYSALQNTDVDINRYLIGFEVLSSNDKKTKAIGVFAIKIGNKYYYVPIIFNNGDLKPILMMYDYNANKFLPFNQEWIDYLINNSTVVLGETSDLTPGDFKLDYIKDRMLPPYTVNNVGSPNHLVTFLKNSTLKVKNTFLECLKDKDFLKEISRAYNFDHIKKACQFNVVNNKQIRQNIFSDMVDINSPEDKIEFLKKGYLVKYGENEVTPIETEVLKEIPKRPGIYNILTSSGKQKGVVFPNPLDFISDKYSGAEVILLNKQEYAIVEPSKIIATPTIEDLDKTIELLLDFTTSLDNMQIGEKYSLINFNPNDKDYGQAVMPFKILNKSKGEAGIAYYTISQNGNDLKLIIKPSGDMIKTDEFVSIPKTYRAIKVSPISEANLLKTAVLYKLTQYNDFIQLRGNKLYKNSSFIKDFNSDYELEEYLSDFTELSIDNIKSGKLCLTKKGQINIQQGQPIMPTPSNIPVQVPMQATVQYKNNIMPEIQKAIGLSQMGMKQVFDTALIGTLSNLTDVTSEIQKYIPSFMEAIDKLAKLLIVFWYKGDLLKEKFSLNEYTDTEMLLKDTFRNLGNITLSLKKKYSILG